MRKILITAAAAVSALAVAAPAAAQWGPAPAPGYGYGYNNNYGQVRSRLMDEARGVEYRLRRSAAYGLNYAEARDLQYRIQRLEYRIQREARDGNGYRNNGYGYGYGDQYGYRDRDRDGRNDRYEDDRGWDHD